MLFPSDFSEIDRELQPAGAQPSERSPVLMEESWLSRLRGEFNLPYMQKLRAFLAAEYDRGRTIFPKKSEYFSAFFATPFEKVRVVILGQDPYHGLGQAHGLSFSVLPGVPLPPSLLNIYKERHSDLGIPIVRNGDLRSWAEQGVLLLNSVLTVEGGLAASHQGRGWEQFTDKVVALLADEREHLVFILWGSYAQKKGSMIDRKRHLVLESPHPSPLSSHRGFFGSKPFSKTNEYLLQHGLGIVDWSTK